MKYKIANPVPTAEELGKMMGMSKARVERVRKIMNAKVRRVRKRG